jgi:hypothetical protein
MQKDCKEQSLPCASRHLPVPGQWVKRIKAKVRWVSRNKAKVQWTFAPANDRARDGSGWCPSGAGLRSDGIAPLNGFARDGEPWTGKRSGTAKRRLGAAERRAGVQAIALSLRVVRRPSSDVAGLGACTALGGRSEGKRVRDRLSGRLREERSEGWSRSYSTRRTGQDGRYSLFRSRSTNAVHAPDQHRGRTAADTNDAAAVAGI